MTVAAPGSGKKWELIITPEMRTAAQKFLSGESLTFEEEDEVIKFLSGENKTVTIVTGVKVRYSTPNNDKGTIFFTDEDKAADFCAEIRARKSPWAWAKDEPGTFLKVYMTDYKGDYPSTDYYTLDEIMPVLEQKIKELI